MRAPPGPSPGSLRSASRRSTSLADLAAQAGDALDRARPRPAAAASSSPNGSRNLTGQSSRPPALEECSPLWKLVRKNSQREEDHRQHRRDRKRMMPMTSVQSLPRCGARAVEQVDPHMLVQPQHVGAAEQEDAGEHLPLDLEPGVRAEAEEIARGGVAGADQAGSASTSQAAIRPKKRLTPSIAPARRSSPFIGSLPVSVAFPGCVGSRCTPWQASGLGPVSRARRERKERIAGACRQFSAEAVDLRPRGSALRERSLERTA